MPKFEDYCEIIRSQFLASFPPISEGALRFLHGWKVPTLAAVEMIAAGPMDNTISIPEAISAAEIRIQQAEAVFA